MDTIDGISVSAPLFLISAMQLCNLCGKENMVAALATNNLSTEEEQEEDGFLLSYVGNCQRNCLVKSASIIRILPFVTA